MNSAQIKKSTSSQTSSGKNAPSTKTKGDAAEWLAEQFLLAQGLRTITRNWRCRMGELDLICDDRGTLVFVEVRSRANARFGGALASITPKKQARMVATAQLYLATLTGLPPCRFDAVLLEGSNPPQWLQDIIVA